MSPKVTNPGNMTSSLSKREKILRKPLSRRNMRLISLRCRYNALSYGQSARRFRFGGATGLKPRARTSWRVASSAPARSMSRAGLAAGRVSRFSSLRPCGAAGRGRGRACRQRLFGHPRQPYEVWCSSCPGTCRWNVDRFLSRPRAIGVHLDAGTVQSVRRNPGPHHPFPLQLPEHPVEHTVPRPPVHACAERVLVAGMCWQATPHAGSRRVPAGSTGRPCRAASGTAVQSVLLVRRQLHWCLPPLFLNKFSG